MPAPATKTQTQPLQDDVTGHFGMRELPFTREIAVKDRYCHPEHEAVLRALREAVAQRMSAALIAPAGSGKSALLRALDASLPRARYRTHYVKVTHLSKRDMCREIACAIGTEPAGTYPTLVRRLQEHFSGATATDGVRPVLLIDDAHDFRPDVLSLVRVLTNFHFDSQLVVSIVLCGQPPLKRLLARDELADVQGRLAHIAVLTALSRTDCIAYIEHRCHVVGAAACPFDRQAQEAVYEISRGNLRAIDRLCRKAMSVAHEAGHDRIDSNHVAGARAMLWPS